MLIYQVQIEIEPSIEKDWLDYMKRKHVPDVLATGLIVTHQVWRVSDSEKPIFHYNYYFKDESAYQQYNEEFAPVLRAEPMEKFNGKFTARRTFYTLI